jgi:two-component system phosphate regulon sensor histidine kinase PhoR
MIASGVPIESKHAAMKIQHAARSMAAMIDNLLMLSASGDMPRGEVEVAPLVATVVGELRPTLRDAAVVTEVGECKAACPPSVLESVVRNIVTNASKYRSPGRRLEVRIVATCAGPWIELAVTDNGLGMSPEDVACAFEPRFRAASTAGVPGHGLGLSIVERMVESIGGSCELTSELGKGTRVVVRIPAAH